MCRSQWICSQQWICSSQWILALLSPALLSTTNCDHQLLFGSPVRNRVEIWSDLHEVKFGNSQEFRAIMESTLRSLGCFCWTDEIPENIMVVWLFVGDCGPDVEGGVSSPDFCVIIIIISIIIITFIIITIINT